MKTKFKKGDRVLTHSTPLFTYGSNNPGGSGFVPNTELIISTILCYATYNVMFFENHMHGIYEGNFSLINQQEEIWF